jgi:aspartate/glutamate racemase
MLQSGESGHTQQVIGLIGGMSWKSSAEYYRLINEDVRARLGGLHSARCLMCHLILRTSRRCNALTGGTKRLP